MEIVSTIEPCPYNYLETGSINNELGLPTNLYLTNLSKIKSEAHLNNRTNNNIAACVNPMSFGIVDVCPKWKSKTPPTAAHLNYRSRVSNVLRYTL